jgi:uncharacterized protein (TIGR03437 family)
VNTRLKAFVLTIFSVAMLSAAPKLRLAQTVLPPITVAQGANGPTQTVEVFNAGDGALNLQVSSSVPWLNPSVGSTHGCTQPAGTCISIQIALQTASLAKGTFTGFVTINDPNAIDAPQTIAVTVNVGGSVPDKLEFFVPPSGSAGSTFTTASQASVTASGGSFLAVSMDGQGSFRFNVPFRVTVTAAPSMANGDFNGTVTVAGSSFASDNKTIPVVLHVTTQAIAQANPAKVVLNAAQGGLKQTATVALSNLGQTALTISNITASAASGGTWLSAQPGADNASVVVNADPAGLAPGAYFGTVTVATNAANSTLTIPVELDVAAPTPPTSNFGGAVNIANFAPGEAFAQGDIVALFGNQFTALAPAQNSSLPLPTSINGVRVFLNDTPVPLYFVSATQINFQVPYDAQPGPATLRVETNGQRGNTISIAVQRIVPRILLRVANFGIILNQDNTYPFPPTPPFPTRRASIGDALTIYAIGLGPTTPAVPSGVAAPSAEPLARVTPPPQVCFGVKVSPFSPAGQVCTDVLFAGLAPTFVGLYQVNVVIPAGAPTGDHVPVQLLFPDGTPSNVVEIAVQ